MAKEKVNGKRMKKDHSYDPGTFLVLAPATPNAPNGEFKHRLDAAKAATTAAELTKRGKLGVVVVEIGGVETPAPTVPATPTR